MKCAKQKSENPMPPKTPSELLGSTFEPHHLCLALPFALNEQAEVKRSTMFLPISCTEPYLRHELRVSNDLEVHLVNHSPPHPVHKTFF